MMIKFALGAGAVAATVLAPSPALATDASQRSANATVYRNICVDGLNIFYREAGPKDGPTLLLLHGFPSSSRMFDPLFPLLSGRYHLVTLDYPGFGHSDAPPPERFSYTFDHLAQVTDHFTEALGLPPYVLYVQDYGGPIGFRLALAHPERVQALIVQNAVAHDEGLGPLWAARRAFWADRASNEAKLRETFLSPDATRLRHVGTSPNVDRYNPDLWTDELAFLSQPGQDRIQLDLFYDYRTNVASYPRWQEYLRSYRPPTLVLWGKYDPSFTVAGATAYGRDVPDAEIHLLEAGHFALDEAADEIAARIDAFLSTHGIGKRG
jgi:pimeloyl-ACP methyl ester carboxylesterase